MQQMISHLTAVILAGGLGTRLRFAVPDRQKVVADVHGRPFLTYLLDQLADAGIRKAVLCTGYRGDQVRYMLGDMYRNIHLHYSREPTPLGTAGAIKFALPLIFSDPVLVMNGDSFYQTDLKRFWAHHHAKRAQASQLLTEVPDIGRYGRVHLGDDGKILQFKEKNGEGGPGLINAGIYLISRHLLERIPSGRKVSLEREMFPTWVGQQFYGYCDTGQFLDIGTPDSYAKAETMLLTP